MKNRIFTMSIREIKSSFKRFLSLFVMSLLGVGVFVGISATPADMAKSMDTYYDNQNLYDIKMISTLGFTDKDIDTFKNIKKVDQVIGTHSKDLLISTGKAESVVKFIGITNTMNKIELKKGRIPKNKNEILVEEALLTKNKLKINDYLTIKEDDIFKEKKLKIVGIVKSPLYIGNVTAASNRGNTTIGTGKVDYYAYIPDESFSMDYYTEVYLTVKGAKEEITGSREYLDLINSTTKSIETIKKEVETARYKEIYNEASNKINKEKEENLVKLNNAKKELDSAYSLLSTGKKTLDTTKVTLDQSFLQLENTKMTLEENKILLDDTKKQLQEAKIEIDAGKEKLNNELEKYQLTYEELIRLIDAVYDFAAVPEEEIIAQIPEDLPYYDEVVTFVHRIYDLNIEEEFDKFLEDPTKIDEIISLLPEDVPYYDEMIEALENYKNSKEDLSKLKNSLETLQNAEEKYQEGVKKYQEGLNKYNDGYNLYLTYLSQYEEGKKKYQEGLEEYSSNYNVYTTGIEEYFNSRKLFDLKINEAYKELDKIPECSLYIYDRSDDKDYSGYLEDGKSIENLAKVFPSIFFIVAVLISLISMSRMVEEDRVEIGTLKSLGFSNKYIRQKYMLYSGIATLLGAIVGSLLGFFLLPYYIWGIYKMLFVIEIFAIDYNLTYVFLGIFISFICICGTTLLTIKKVVKEKPSDLMRGKAPAKGKRVLLEKISFLWKRISFSNKVTIRNLFRYKKRVLMTVVGILGCTALMLTGFGIRDSIVDIANMQYGRIFHFDDMIYLNGTTSEEEIKSIVEDSRIKNYVSTRMASGTSENYSTNLFVPENEKDLKNVLSLKELDTGKNLSLTEENIIISDKLSELTNTSIGDRIEFTDATGKTYQFKVSSICENYAGNYIFMNKETYEKKIGNYSTNVIYMNLNNLKQEEKVSKDILENDHVMSIVSSKTTISTISDMLKTLDSVVVLLIFLSGALSFVVLYNLSFINISERKREIATLKVLGFTHKEVDNYINKETMILTVIGILFGLLFGVVLTNIIIDTVEIESVRFIHHINFISFLVSALMTLLFTIIVNVITHFTLKKIDMIESLKSVE